MSQRVVQYQAVIQMAQMAPDIYDLPQLHRNMLEVLGIKDADRLVPLPDDQKPKDPVSENMAALRMEPLKAFFYQDHESHIKVHMMAMQDPIVMQLIGQNPKAPMIQSSMMAHIAEHVGFAYRQKIEQQMGMPLPPEGENMSPEVEMALSAMMAQAAAQVLQQNQAQAAQQQAQQQAKDPVLQMQQQELQLRQQEVQIKGQEVQGKLQLEQQRLQMDAMAKMEQAKQNNKKLQIDALAKTGQLKQQKSAGQNNAMSQAGALQRQRQQMGMDLVRQAAQNQQQKERPTK
jgi:hypothetical protein